VSKSLSFQAFIHLSICSIANESDISLTMYKQL
jgi:hypothetical protein